MTPLQIVIAVCKQPSTQPSTGPFVGRDLFCSKALMGFSKEDYTYSLMLAEAGAEAGAGSQGRQSLTILPFQLTSHLSKM